jgi:CheY-like chemotaxis protein
MLERIFEPFLQVERGLGAREGLGIGLSLTRKLVEAQQGTIEARSDGLGRGSELIVRFPLSHLTAAVIDPSTEGRSGPTYAFADYRVLVVDDNRDAAEAIASLLRLKGGFIAACAYTGTEARELQRRFRPNAIVLDIGLPDINGFEVASALRNEDGFVGPIIAVTGFGQEEDVLRTFEAGIDYHFTKPVSIDDLISVAVAPRSVGSA